MPDGSYNTLTIGNGEVAIVARRGHRGPTKDRTPSEPSPRGGTVSGPADRGPREVLLTLGLRAFTEEAFVTLRQRVYDALVPGVTQPYWFDGFTKYVNVRVADVEVPEDHQFPGPDRMAEATVVMIGDDPLIYGPNVTGNLTTGAPLAVANTGTATAPFSFTTGHACADPRVRRNDDPTNLVYRWQHVVVASPYELTVDTRARTARYGFIDEWPPLDNDGNPALDWGIPPGGATLTLAVDSGNPTFVVTSRSAWVA